ncbi:beta strand repeat-containing protein [Luteolibacter soli]|uniref:Autotransporter-associated beta strand repeat-containing protein n=1 Tax=Luteolibacter soli TaxID=3135280 RepID=A0ABU9AP63_9BACT
MKISVFLAPACVLLSPTLHAQVASVASGDWTTATVWSDSTAPAAGKTYQVTSGFTVDSPVGANNSTTTFAGDSLSLQGGGILRLRHTASGGNTTVTINPKPLSLGAGGTLQSYSTSLGNVVRNVPSAIDVGASGSVNFTIQSDNTSAYTNRLNLQGVLSGSANIDLKGVLQGQTGERRTLSVSNAANTLSGNWTVEGTNTTDNARRLFLEAAATNALGSGSVTLNTRSQLRVASAGSIDATGGITLATATSNLQLQNAGGWVNPAAFLTVNGGAVALGTGASSVGSLSGTGGSITGEGPSSALTVNQTTNGTYAGSLTFSAGNGLAFTKGGAADLQLTGAINAAVPITLNNGGLGIGSGTLASLTQNGGSLQLALGTAPTIAGNYTRTAGGIAVQVSSPPDLGTPYTVVTYQGTLTGSPPVTVGGLGGSRLNPAVNYGSGSNSAITVTFSGTAGSLAWKGSPGGTWDVNTSSNWTNGGSPDKFFQFDHVSFTDGATGTTSVVLNDMVTPGSVTFDHSTKSYSLSGSGAISGVTNLVKSGTGTLTLATNNNYTGETVINAGTVQVGSGGTAGSLGTGAVINDGTLAFNRSDAVTIANAISGMGSLSQLGAGTVVLTADNSYTGATTVNAGRTLQVGNGGAAGSLGDTTAVTNNGTITFNRSGTFTVTPPITGSGALIQNGPGTVILAGDAGYTGTTTIAAGTLQVGANDVTGSLLGPVVDHGTLAISRFDDINFANVISGSGSVTHNGSGTLRLTGANTYAGTTGVSGGGTLVLDSTGSSIPAGTGIVLSNGSLDFTNLNLTVPSFTKAPSGGANVYAQPGKTLTVQGSANLLINQGGLNLAIDSFVFNNPIGSFNAVTTASGGSASVNAAVQNNTITAATFGIGNGGPGGSGVSSNASVTLGQANVIHADTIAIGTNQAQSGSCSLLGSGGVGASLAIRGAAGGSTRANMTVGYKTGSDYAGGSATVDVTGEGSTLDALLGTLVIGRHDTGAGNFNNATSGTFAFTGGTLDATAIQLAIAGAPNNKTANGTLTTYGGTIKTGTLTLVQDSGGAMGTANVNLEEAGILEATTVTGQVATNALIHLQNGATFRNTSGSNLTVTGTTLDVPATSTAALAIGAPQQASFDGGSAFKLHYDSSASTCGKLTVSGAVTLGANAVLSLVDDNGAPVAFTVGQKFVLLDYSAGSLTGTFTGLADGGMLAVGSQLFVVDYNDPAYAGKAVTLTVPAANTFTTWSAINAGGEGADGDYDKDGVANAVEYLMGQTGSTFTPNPQVVNGKVTWPKDALALASWAVQTSSNLAAEGQPGGWTNAVVGVADLGTSIEFTLPAGNPKVFARLKVTVP